MKMLILICLVWLAPAVFVLILLGAISFAWRKDAAPEMLLSEPPSPAMVRETDLEHQGDNPEHGAPRGDHQTEHNPKLGVEGQVIGPSSELL